MTDKIPTRCQDIEGGCISSESVNEKQNKLNLERKKYLDEIEELKRTILQLNPHYQFKDANYTYDAVSEEKHLHPTAPPVQQVQDPAEDTLKTKISSTKSVTFDIDQQGGMCNVGSCVPLKVMEELEKTFEFQRKQHQEELQSLKEIIVSLTNSKKLANESEESVYKEVKKKRNGELDCEKDGMTYCLCKKDSSLN